MKVSTASLVRDDAQVFGFYDAAMITKKKLNFFKAYAAYCAYCKRADVAPYSVKGFSELWQANKHDDHRGCNYNYLEV